ncbi:MAG TPA: site-2 protease family protein [Tepidisphaeraceae bacterium]
MSQLPGQYPGPEEPATHPLPPAHGYQYELAAPVAVQPRRANRGLLGYLTALALAVFGYLKYAFILFKAVPFLPTIITLLISFYIYAQWQGPAFAGGLVGMILIHEMGHVVEIRRQGMKATAPIFIPFLGAAIFQRSHPQDALRQAQIGIAGPLLGTVGATAAYALYGSTHWFPLLLAAWLGFYINLFNLIPFGMLDGGWILAPVSKWFQLLGIALLALVTIFGHLNPLIYILIIASIPSIYSRFRHADHPYYRSVSTRGKVGMGAAWLVLAIFLGLATNLAGGELSSLYHYRS